MTFWIHLHPDLAEEMTQWHASGGDPLYAAISRYTAGKFEWDKSGTRPLLAVTEREFARILETAREIVADNESTGDVWMIAEEALSEHDFEPDPRCPTIPASVGYGRK